MSKRDSQNIKTAFTLAIVAHAIGDGAVILYLLSQSILLGAIQSMDMTFIILILAILLAPLVLGIVSLSKLKEAKVIQGRDKPFAIIARILAIIAIVGSALVLFYIVLVVWIIGLLIGVFAL